MAGTIFKCSGRSSDTALVIYRRTSRTYTGRNDQKLGTTGTSNTCSFLWRGNDTIHPSFLCQLCQSNNLLCNSVLIIKITKLLIIHTGQNSNSNQFRRRASQFCSSFTHRFNSCLHHLFTAYGMYIHHICT